jgi:chloramphenicol 3-O phosphotransferase
MTKERIIFLNGSSSAGKSTLAATLQKRLAEPYRYMSLDNYLQQFGKMVSEYQKLGQSILPSKPTLNYPPKFSPPSGLGGLPFLQLVPRFHQAVAAAANAGNRVIVDHVLQHEEWLKECLTLFEGLEVVFVGLYCPLEELERRELRRGDREPGLAKFQHQRVHAHGVYDIELDTSALTPEKCASIIVQYINSGNSPTAFEKLRQNLRNGNDDE